MNIGLFPVSSFTSENIAFCLFRLILD